MSHFHIIITIIVVVVLSYKHMPPMSFHLM